MNTRFAVRGCLHLLFVPLTLSLAGSVWACPLCKVAGGDLADESQPAAQADAPGTDADPLSDSGVPAVEPAAPGNDLGPLRFGLSLDVSNAYFHHGYMQQNRGVVFQPLLSISTQPIDRGDWVIEPYFIWFNSLHTANSPGYAGGHGGHGRYEQQYERYLDEPHEGAPFPHYHERLVDVLVLDKSGRGWFETELMPGILFTNGPWKFDFQLRGRFFPSDFHDLMIEAGGRVRYDVASLFDDRKPGPGGRPTVVELSAAVFHELKDDNGAEETYVELGIEPKFFFKIGGQQAVVSFPLLTGLSPNGFYRDSDYADETFGFVSAGAKFTYQLPSNRLGGRWFFNAGIEVLGLTADSTQFSNGGDNEAVVFRMGIGAAY